jgi:predicted ATPase/class 3 adenylate cyclase
MITLLFTDVEGSTRLLHEVGAGAYGLALADHRAVLREAFAAHGGVEIDTQGDAFFVAFASAPDAVAAATQAQRALGDGPILVRMGLHTGEPQRTAEGYVGIDVHLGARIAAAGHGGQVLMSGATRTALAESRPMANLSELGDVVDLGEHRLKDFDRPLPIFQLGTGSFPPLRTISNTNLPHPASSFVGREAEVRTVADHLRDGTRLLTLTGPGGSGKTRLAIEAAAELVPSFKGGVFWIGLAELRDPDLVVPTIERTLGAKGSLAAHIADRDMLLIVDNLEQVVAAAARLSELTEACPNLRLLTTSRERLRVRGEVEMRVPPLAHPDAARLFGERSGADADDPDVLALCAALDNLPLALELAAARAAIMSPAEIHARLGSRLDLLRGGRDANPRQQTLRATIEWSHDLLEPEERRLFGRLAVFRGGWTLEAAEAVADADLNRLQALVDKSLVRYADGRFGMLQTIREFAAERLDAFGERASLETRHAVHFLALGELAEPHLRGDSLEWLDRLDADRDNLREALDELSAQRDTQGVLRLVGAIHRYWYLRGHVREGRARLEAALDADERPTSARAFALDGAAVMALNLGDNAAAERNARQALALHEEFHEAWGEAYSTMMVGNALAEAGDIRAARPFMQDAIRRFGALEDQRYILVATANLAWIVEESGDIAGGKAIHERAIGMARALGSDRMIAGESAQLAMILRDEGRLREARAMLAEATAITHARGDRLQLGLNFGRTANVLALLGRHADAARLLAAAEHVFESIAAQAPAWASERDEATREVLRRALSHDELVAATSQGRALTTDDAVALAIGDDP